MWITFSKFVATRCAPGCILEVSELFDRAGYNDLFNSEIDRLLARVVDPDVRRELEEAKLMDWVGYISASLRRSGVQEADLDAHVHQLVIKLLIDPGSLFRRWNGGAPIIARFKTSVRNGIINLAEKRRTRRRRFGTGGAVPEEIVAREPSGDDQAVEAFRRLVWERLGELGLAILDLRLSGTGDTKKLVGAAVYGKPSSYRVKETVKDIKRLAADYARMTGDDELLAKVNSAMRAEKETVRKRFGLASAVS
jgi:hypothetical protein